MKDQILVVFFWMPQRNICICSVESSKKSCRDSTKTSRRAKKSPNHSSCVHSGESITDWLLLDGTCSHQPTWNSLLMVLTSTCPENILHFVSALPSNSGGSWPPRHWEQSGDDQRREAIANEQQSIRKWDAEERTELGNFMIVVVVVV